MRPKKTRRVRCSPEERVFRPHCRSARGLERVLVSLDEFEAIRLADREGMTHQKAALLMRVSRPTFTRILASAHEKVANGLVGLKAIHISGGCCQLRGGRT